MKTSVRAWKVRRVARTATLTAVAAASAAGAVSGQDWSGWSFYWENDTWVREGSSDDAFTNGLRLVLGRASASHLPLTDWLTEHWPLAPSGSVGTSAIVIGQNMFTPLEITDYVPDSADRPYAGLAYIGARWDVTEPHDPVSSPESRHQHSFEVDAGVMGSGAGGHPIQSAVHSTITTHRLPKGWAYQIDNSFALSALYEWRWKYGWHFFDVVPHAGLLAGTVQTYPFAGLNVRLGWNMSSFPAPLGRNTAAPTSGRPGWEAGLVAGLEGREMWHNAPITGRFSERDPGVEPRREVGDYRLGAFLRLMDWRLSYTFVRRSPEVEGAGPSGRRFDNYGSIAIDYEPGGNNDMVGERLRNLFEDHLPAVFDGFVLEAGVGGDLLGDDGEVEPVVETHGMHVAVGRKLGGALDDFDALFEINGVGREFGPAATPGGDHFDRMLINRGLALRYRLPFDLLGQAHVRAGWLWSTMEYEATPAQPGPRTCPAGASPQVGGDPGSPIEKTFCVVQEKGSGPMAAVGYTYQRWPFTDVLGLNIDLSWNRNDTDRPRDFLALTAGIRWLPG